MRKKRAGRAVKKRPRQDQIWCRLGYSGAYARYDSIDDFCGAHEEVAWGAFVRWSYAGFTTTTFPDENYVSLYRGDSKGSFTGELRVDEKHVVEAMVHLHPGRGLLTKCLPKYLTNQRS